MLKDDIKLILTEYESMKPRLTYNYELFDIYEGNLLQYILADIAKQVSAESFKSMEPRVVPINFLKKLIDKLSQIYNQEPHRELIKEDHSDEVLFDFYKNMMAVDVEMSLATEIFNLEKYVAVEPYIDNGIPSLRVVSPDKFFVVSTSTINPMKVTHYIKIMGKINGKDVLHVYTDAEFLIINTDGDILTGEMETLNNSKGVNYIGKIPAIYISRSKFDLMPRPDTDLLKMTKILPILFSDLNDVVFWQSFSIIYGIDLGSENLKMAPNSFWSFKSDPSMQTKPEIGSIKPQADIEAVMNFIMFQLNTWLNTRGIKSFAVGNSNQQTSASGISKVIDELDTSEDRKKQIPFFKRGEIELWNLIFHFMHPYWVRNNMINVKEVFTPNQQVIVEFREQLAPMNRNEILDECKKEIDMGILTRRMALKKLNPQIEEKKLDELMEEIDEESTVEVPYVDENKNKDTEVV